MPLNEEHQRPSNQTYRPALDGVRALAILPVLIFHLRESWWPGGFVGVDVFFVISGYLITTGIFRDLERNKFSFLRFYQRRIARLFPAMALVLAATTLAAFLLYDKSLIGLFAPTVAASAASLANVQSAYGSNYFHLALDAHPLLHFWSLSVEEQFYLLFPLLMVLLWRSYRASIKIVIAVLAMLSLIACIVTTSHNQTWAFYMLPTRAWELLAGASLALQQDLPRDAGSLSRKVSAWAGLTLVLVSVALVRSTHFPGTVALVPVFGAVLLIFGIVGDTNVVVRVLRHSLLVRIGRLSYVLYLWHLPIFCFVDYRLLEAALWKRTLLKLVLTVVFSVATASLLENPARRWLNRGENRAMAFAGAVVVVMVALSSALWLRLYGWPEPRVSMVAHGGLALNTSGQAGSVAIMGDSLACASSSMLHEIAAENNLQFYSLCLSSTSPLQGIGGDAWNRMFAGVQHTRPKVLVMQMAWPDRPDLPVLLQSSVASLSPYTQHIVFVTQYPMLADNMPREGIREGSRPPFAEPAWRRDQRVRATQILRAFAKQHGITLVETEGKFKKPDGSVRVLDERDRPLYIDWIHASSFGTALYRSDLEQAVRAPR